MGIDIRLPIGALFTVLGAILAIHGAVADPSIHVRSAGWNINLWWGLLLLLFGVAFLAAGWRRRK